MTTLFADFFYTPPLHVVYLGSTVDLVALTNFGIVAVVVGSLVDLFVRQARSLQGSQSELVRLVSEQSALRRVATRVAHGESPGTVFGAVAAEGGRVLGAEAMLLMRSDKAGAASVVGSWRRTGPATAVGTTVALHGDDVATRVLRSGHSARSHDGDGLLADTAGSVIGAPMEKQLWGVLLVALTRDAPLPEEIEEHFVDFADLVATTIAGAQAQVDLASSRVRMVAAGDEIRRRIGRDLHDGTQQRLVSLMLELRDTAESPVHRPEVRAELRKMVRELDSTLDEVRELARGIHPAVLSRGGLRTAIGTLARRSAVPVEADMSVEGRLPAPVEVTAYYMAAEALTNAAKHAQASVIRLNVTVRDRWLHILVQDDGRGGADPVLGSGLVGITDRVESLGGTLTLHSPPGAGTTLTVELPADIDTRLSMSG